MLTSRILTITWVTYIATWVTIIRPNSIINVLYKLGPDHANVTELSRLLAAVQRVLDSQRQAPDHHDRTQLNQPQKRGPDQTDFEFANCKRRR